MNCPTCGRPNPTDSRFCFECGGRMAGRRAQCQAEIPGGVKFCNQCGAPTAMSTSELHEREPLSYTPKHLAEKILASKSALEGERKQVTVLFADVKSSMELAESVDPEEWHAILDRFFQILADGVHRFDGTVNQYTGDGIMALFGAPIAHEDHAQRACFAALQLRDALREYAEELKRTRGLAFAVRIGINSGEVVVGKIGDDLRMDYTAQGHTVGLAQRLEALADPGRAYVAAATARLVAGYFTLRDLGEFTLKGMRESVRVHELEGTGALRTRFDLSRARGLSRFVGRAAEMATLDAAVERAIQGQGSVLGVVAEPGTGKSRLCFELCERARARGIPVREAHGVPHGKQVPFLPVLALLRGLFGIGERDGDAEARQKIAGALVLLDASFERSLPIWFDFLGVPDPSRPALELPPEDRERLVLEGVRRLIRARSELGPALILLEDLHWFDGASERMLATLVEAVRETRALLLVNFRPEFHADWMQRSGYQQLPLPPLGPEAAAELLRALLGADPALAPLAARIAAHAGGNPFFVEELVQALVEDGSLVGSRGAHRLARAVDALALPATVQAVLAARIDRLAEREKQVLQGAAVIGPEFDARILARVSELAEPELLASLRALAQAELVLERSLYPEVVYGFKHPLTQEVALRSQLGARRAERHAAAARALEALTAPEKLDEQAALLAHHWHEADEKLAAARWHLRAARWARRRAPPETERHVLEVRRLCDSLPASQETGALGLAARSLLVGLGAVLLTPAASVREFLREGREIADRGGDRRVFAEMLATFGAVRSVGTATDHREAISSLAEAEAIADSLGDRSLRQRVRLQLLMALREAGRLREAEALARAGVEDATDPLLLRLQRLHLSRRQPRPASPLAGAARRGGARHRPCDRGDAARRVDPHHLARFPRAACRGAWRCRERFSLRRAVRRDRAARPPERRARRVPLPRSRARDEGCLARRGGRVREGAVVGRRRGTRPPRRGAPRAGRPESGGGARGFGRGGIRARREAHSRDLRPARARARARARGRSACARRDRGGARARGGAHRRDGRARSRAGAAPRARRACRVARRRGESRARASRSRAPVPRDRRATARRGDRARARERERCRGVD